MKLTIAEYFTPNGRSIDGEGITPDVEVEYEADENNPEADNQLEKSAGSDERRTIRNGISLFFSAPPMLK